VMINGIRVDKVFTVGDYFGEISIFTGDKRTASIIALTHAVIYEFKGPTLLSILQGTKVVETLQHLAVMRQHHSWTTISKNTVLYKLTSSQKTQLQAILHPKKYTKGSIIWTIDDFISFSCLIDEGGVILSKDDGTSARTFMATGGKKDPPSSCAPPSSSPHPLLLLPDDDEENCHFLGSGSFICDYLELRKNGGRQKTTLIAASDVLLIPMLSSGIFSKINITI